MLKISKQLFNHWNSGNVRYCHWKSNEHLMEGLDGKTDLDVYVFLEDKPAAEKSLLELDFIKFKQQPYCTYPNVDEWIGFDYDTGALIHVHLHYKIITGTKYNKEYVFPLDNLIIDTRIKNEETEVYTTSYELELLILYSRITLKANDKKHIIPDNDYLKEIAYLKKRFDRDSLKSLLDDILKEDASKVYLYIVKESLSPEDWHELFLIILRWLKPYRSKSKIHVFSRYYYFVIRNIIISILNNRFGGLFFTKKALPNRGISICFIGVDGSGKSTVSKDISKWLSWKIENHSFYLGSGDGYKRNQSVILRLVNKFRHSAHNLVDISKYYVLQLKKAEKYIQRGGIAIYDRFPQIQFRGLYDGPKIAIYYADDMDKTNVARMARMEEKNIEFCQTYQPNLLFKLVIPVEESIRRKHDDEVIIRKKYDITEKLCFEHSDTHIIDGTQDYAQEILIIKRIIWKGLLTKQ